MILVGVLLAGVILRRQKMLPGMPFYIILREWCLVLDTRLNYSIYFNTVTMCG